MLPLQKRCLSVALMMIASSCFSASNGALAADFGQQARQSIVQTISGKDLAVLMKKEGYQVELDKDGDLLWKLDEMNAGLILSEDQKSLLFVIYFTDSKVPLDKINQWNRDKRYSRSFLDEEGNPHLELDLDLSGGVTSERIADFMKTCRVSLLTWLEEIVLEYTE